MSKPSSSTTTTTSTSSSSRTYTPPDDSIVRFTVSKAARPPRAWNINVTPFDLALFSLVGAGVYGAWRWRRWNEQRCKTTEELRKAREVVRAHRDQRIRDVLLGAGVLVGACFSTYTYYALKGYLRPDGYTPPPQYRADALP